MIEAIQYHNKDLAMPPKEEDRLTEAQVADLVAWVQMGAPDPRVGTAPVMKSISIEESRSHWAFQPGSQQYWLQAFNNVMYGRWEKIDDGYGKAVLGYFGKTPLPPDLEVVKKASEQLNKPVFTGDPLEAAPKNIEPAKKALEERILPITDENIFIVLASVVHGKKMELNEGIRLLMGQGKIDIPLKKKEEPKKEEKPKEAVVEAIPAGPVRTKCMVDENGKTRTFIITSEPISTPGFALRPVSPEMERLIWQSAEV